MSQPPRPQTLGDVLYTGHAARGLTEADWVELVQSVAAGDRRALDRLYARTHRVVFTLLMRLTSNARIASEAMIHLYQDLWRGSLLYEAANGTVLGWIVNQVRARGMARRNDDPLERDAGSGALLPDEGPNYQDLLQAKEGARRVRMALLALAPDERSAIELAFFSELSVVEVANRTNHPVASVTAALRSGLHKLRHALRGPEISLSSGKMNGCDRAALVCAHALGALAPKDAALIEAHVASCRSCRRERESLQPIVDSFHFWPTDVLRPPASLGKELAHRVAAESGGGPEASLAIYREPEWNDVAPGISCKLLASDANSHRVSMLVRLAPGGEYPPHTHAGVEELHLLDGELWIDERKLHPGDYNRAEPGTRDKRVWSETGCTCVLTTSTRDVLG